MTLREALIKGTDILKNANIEAPAVDAGVMLCHVIGYEKSYLYAHSDDSIDIKYLEKYFELTAARSKGMPVQYIVGHQEFMSLDFNVGQGVLIPRQDTETLVEVVIELCKKYEFPVKILEIGTGSGCIAVSLAYFIKNCSVVAVDISANALEIACGNALKNSVAGRIDFVRSNLFDSLDATGFNIIVSNPPYARRGDIITLQREVKDYEPIEALDGGEDGLLFYRKIVEKAAAFLITGGQLIFEVGYDQADAVVELMGHDYTDIRVVKDLSGIKRVVFGVLKF